MFTDSINSLEALIPTLQKDLDMAQTIVTNAQKAVTVAQGILSNATTMLEGLKTASTVGGVIGAVVNEAESVFAGVIGASTAPAPAALQAGDGSSIVNP